jgi:hypothetical protein
VSDCEGTACVLEALSAANLKNNDIYDNSGGSGLMSYGCSSTVVGNRFLRNLVGIELLGQGGKEVIRDNDVSESVGAGISTHAVSAKSFSFAENSIHKNCGPGLEIHQGSAGKFICNKIMDNVRIVSSAGSSASLSSLLAQLPPQNDSPPPHCHARLAAGWCSGESVASGCCATTSTTAARTASR